VCLYDFISKVWAERLIGIERIEPVKKGAAAPFP